MKWSGVRVGQVLKVRRHSSGTVFRELPSLLILLPQPASQFLLHAQKHAPYTRTGRLLKAANKKRNKTFAALGSQLNAL